MHLCSTLLVILLLTWTEQGRCTVRNGKTLSYEKRELLALYDKIEEVISPLLPSKELKDVVHDIIEKLKSRLCDVAIEENALQEVIKAGNEIMNKVLNKKTDISEIIGILMKSVVQNMDKLIGTMIKKTNNRVKEGKYNN